ncbi:D(2)-like dopamine receptor [Clytia hemisphaerica]|uniref:D(2)-like dopamine receptor n=1 Tax=Clytia hemisphaerica TaxID=252671 RepID=UPI0034D72530
MEEQHLIDSGNSTTTHPPHTEISLHCSDFILISGSSIYYIPVGIICAFTIGINLLTILTFLRFRRLCQNNNNLLILSLSIADLLVPIVTIVVGAVLAQNIGDKISTYNSYLISPLCVAILISGLTLIIMTLDRLVAVQKPLKYHSFISRDKVIKSIVVVWVIPISLGVTSVLMGETSLSMYFMYISFIAIVTLIVMVLFTSNTVLFLKAIKASNKVKPRIQSMIKSTLQNGGGEEEVSRNMSCHARIQDSPATDINCNYTIAPLPEITPQDDSTKHDVEDLKQNNIEQQPKLLLQPRGLTRRAKSLGVTPLHRSTLILPPLRERASTTGTISDEGESSVGAIRSDRDKSLFKHPSRSLLQRWRKSHLRSKQKYLTCLICLLFTIIYISCMLPVSIHIAGLVSGTWCSTGEAFRVFTLLPLINSFLNPLLYFFKRKDFRKHVRKFKRTLLNKEKS